MRCLRISWEFQESWNFFFLKALAYSGVGYILMYMILIVDQTHILGGPLASRNHSILALYLNSASIRSISKIFWRLSKMISPELYRYRSSIDRINSELDVNGRANGLMLEWGQPCVPEGPSRSQHACFGQSLAIHLSEDIPSTTSIPTK